MTNPEPAEIFIDAKVIMSSNVRFLPSMRHTIENLTMELGWTDSEARAITLAVEEALTNKIRHAYANRTDGRIQFEFRTESGALVFQLTDQGEPPDPGKICASERGVPTPGGLGTHIIRDVMDSVIYQTVAEGNQLIMTKRLPNSRHNGAEASC